MFSNQYFSKNVLYKNRDILLFLYKYVFYSYNIFQFILISIYINENIINK